MRSSLAPNQGKSDDGSVELIVAAQDTGPGNYLGLILDAWPGPSFFITGRPHQAPLRADSSIKISLKHLEQKLAAPHPAPRVIVTGTSFGGASVSTDKALVNSGSKFEVPTVSIIETWNLFRERFTSSDGLALPDFIIVNDRVAKALASSAGLPSEKILALGNPIFEDLERARNHRAARNQSTGELKKVLFISEKIRDSWIWTIRNYDEFSCLPALRGALPEGCQLVVKLHPEEEPWKYSALAKQGVEVRKEMSVSEMVHVADRIVGMDSTLLYELSIFRDDIISFVPNQLSGSIFSDAPNITCVSSSEGLADALTRSATSFNKQIDSWRGSTEKIVKFLMSIAT